jgi:hypothetical protein
MLEAVRGSAVLASLCRQDRLLRDYSKLDPLTQWRLYSVALWERTFEVSV